MDTLPGVRKWMIDDIPVTPPEMILAGSMNVDHAKVNNANPKVMTIYDITIFVFFLNICILLYN